MPWPPCKIIVLFFLFYHMASCWSMEKSSELKIPHPGSDRLHLQCRGDAASVCWKERRRCPIFFFGCWRKVKEKRREKEFLPPISKLAPAGFFFNAVWVFEKRTGDEVPFALSTYYIILQGLLNQRLGTFRSGIAEWCNLSV